MKTVLFHIGNVADSQVAEMRATLTQTGWHEQNIIEVIVPEPRNAALLQLATVLEDHPSVSVLYSSADNLFVDGSVESATLYNVCVNQEVGLQTADTIIPISQFPQPIVSPPPISET
ncbi:MAG TPA: hypothetical protein VGD98_00410 [Ktedonobacteraceae bacterium]